MANANARHLTSVATEDATSIQKLHQIAALLVDPADLTPVMLRIRIRAIYEGCEVPTDRQKYVALATRAGCTKASMYRAWREEFGARADEDPAPDSPLPPRRRNRPRRVTAISAALDLSALYRYFDDEDLLLYAGISDELHDRVEAHIDASTWMCFAARSTIQRFPTRAEAAAAEIAAIKDERPLFNQMHNSTPEAQQRLVEYLVKRNRLDLLAPAISRG